MATRTCLGLFDSDFEAFESVSPYEPHHDIIASPKIKNRFMEDGHEIFLGNTTVLEQSLRTT